MILEELRVRYQNAKEFFNANWDNPKYSEKALRLYQEASDVYYFFLHGERIHKRNERANLVNRLREVGGLGV